MPKPDLSKCLTNEQFAQYLANKRAGVVLGEFDDHIEGCDICKGRFFFLKRIRGATTEQILANWPKSKPKERERAMEFMRKLLTKPTRRREDDED